VTDAAIHGQNPLRFRPLLVVPDANIFTGYAWTEQLLVEARRGRVQLYWSPKILEETGRVRLWIWIKRTFRRSQPPTGSSGWKALWMRYSEEAHAWFSRVSPYLWVIDDREPHEPAWIEPHPDPNDAWLWNTARRVNADFVVTVNLKDGPPVDPEGLRSHENAIYVHPSIFAIFLSIWGDILESGEMPGDLDRFIRDTAGQQSTRDFQTITILLRAMLAKIAEENAAEQA